MSYTSPGIIRGDIRSLPKSITDPDIQQQINRADTLINAKLGGIFSVPFEEPIPKLIGNISTDLTIFFMYENLYSSQQPNLDKYQEKRYKRAMKLLQMIIDGELNIGVPPLGGSSSGFATTNNHDPIFTLEKPEW